MTGVSRASTYKDEPELIWTISYPMFPNEKFRVTFDGKVTDAPYQTYTPTLHTKYIRNTKPRKF